MSISRASANTMRASQILTKYCSAQAVTRVTRGVLIRTLAGSSGAKITAGQMRTSKLRGSSRSYPCEHCYQWQSSQAINDVCAGSLNTKKAEYAASYASRCGFLGVKYLARVKIAAVCVKIILPCFLS